MNNSSKVDVFIESDFLYDLYTIQWYEIIYIEPGKVIQLIISTVKPCTTPVRRHRQPDPVLWDIVSLIVFSKLLLQTY